MFYLKAQDGIKEIVHFTFCQHKHLFLFSQGMEHQDGIRNAYMIPPACHPPCPRAPGCPADRPGVPGTALPGCAGHGLGGSWTPTARRHGPFVPPTPRSLSACVERQGWQPKSVSVPTEAQPERPLCAFSARPGARGAETETQKENVFWEAVWASINPRNHNGAPCFSFLMAPTRKTLVFKNRQELENQ